MYAESVHPCAVWPVCWALLCNLVFLLPQNKIQTTCLSNNEFKTRTGKAPHIPPFPHSPPSLLSDHHHLPSLFSSVRLLFLRPTSYLSPHPRLTQYILMSLFSCVRSHHSLLRFYPTAAWGQVQLSVKWMIGNWVPAESVCCDLLTYCLNETWWGKCTVGKECKWKKP